MSNTSECGVENYEDCFAEQKLIFIPEVQTTFLVLYAVISVAGILGNLFIVLTVIRYALNPDGLEMFFSEGS